MMILSLTKLLNIHMSEPLSDSLNLNQFIQMCWFFQKQVTVFMPKSSDS